MDYCEIQRHLKDSSKSQNVFNTMLYCHQIDSYLERNRILEIIGELMIRVCIDRPEDENLVDYLCQKLMEISEKYLQNVVKLEFLNATDEASNIITQLSARHHIPVIECVSDETSRNEILKRVFKFMRDNLSREHRIIVFDFKVNAKKEKVLRITRGVGNETSRKASSKPQDVIEIQLSGDCLNHHQVKFIYDNVRNMKPKRMIKGNWNRRLWIVGRMGSGRKTQGVLIANEFGLNLIDVDSLMDEYQQRQTFSMKHKLGFWGYLQETLLKPNCLRNGYVIVSGVISRDDLEILMEKFVYEPNRIIFLHTSPKECERRLSSTKRFLQNVASTPETNVDFNYQMNLYDLHKKEFVEYFTSRRHRILHIRGAKAIHEIKTLIWANLVED